MKARTKKIVKGWTDFFRSLRFRILLILVLIGIVPSIIVEKGIVNSYEERAVSVRTYGVRNQCEILINQVVETEYWRNQSSVAVGSELTMLTNVYNGRIMLIDSNFRVIKDTYNMDEGKYIISSDVISCFKDETESIHYDPKNRYIEMLLPVHATVAEKEVLVAVMLISVSTEEIVSSIEILEEKGDTMLIFIAVLVVAFGYVLSGILMKPFGKITKSIEGITDGFQNENISVNDYTETELITDAFNQMLARVRAIDNSRQEFVSNVSHELKTPLTSMKVLADSLVGQENVPLELYQEFMQDIANEIDRENKIVTDLLTLVRMDKKAANMQIGFVNVNEMLEMILKRLKPIASKKNVDLTLESIRQVDAEVDETKMGLAMNNLVENAIKYNVEDGWVKVTLDADHKYFYVTVADSGMGIPEESMDHIFERFYRVDKSHSTAIEGTGLGLAITKSAIMMHHGAIRVKSKEKEGTTFSVRIPLKFIK